METKLAKWGNSVGLRLPKEIVARSALQSGDSISISLEKDSKIVLTPKQRKITLAELVEAITPENQHDPVDWGRPAGKEAW